MTTIQRIAQLFGWIFVVIAIWGAFLSGTTMQADPALAPRLWGLFPVNFLHNLVHLGFGLWGLWAVRSFTASRGYAVGAGALYLVLAVLGLVSPDGFGLVPLGGNDIWLHALAGGVLLIAGVVFSGDAGAKVEPAGTRTVMPPPTASSPEGTVTRIPVQPEEPEGHAEPVEPKPAGSEGAADAAPPPELPDHVVDEPPRQPGEDGAEGEEGRPDDGPARTS